MRSSGTWANVVDILRAEVAELIRLGCIYIQIDAPQYAAPLDPEIREATASWTTP